MAPNRARWIAAGAAAAMAAGLLTGVVRATGGDEAATAGTRSGIVVALATDGPTRERVAADLPLTMTAQVVASAPVVAVELWADGDVVSRVVPDPTATELAVPMTWSPPAGTHLLTARVIDERSDVAVSNTVVATATTETAIEVTGADQGGTAVPEWGPVDSPTAAISASAPLPPLPNRYRSLAPLDVTTEVDGCGVIVRADGASEDLAITRVDSSDAAVELDMRGPNRGPARDDAGPGPHRYLVHREVEGARRVLGVGFATVPPDCDGARATGLRLDQGILTGVDAEVAEAYLYLSVDDGPWQRVPSDPQSAVPRGAAGFDVSELLPDLAGHPAEVEVWGRTGANVRGLGRISIGAGRPSARTRLDWIKMPASQGSSEVLATSGYVTKPSTLRFRWSTELPYVTHAHWQVLAGHPAPSPSLLAPPGLVLSGTADGDSGVITVDLSKIGTATMPDTASVEVGPAIGNYLAVTGSHGVAERAVADPEPLVNAQENGTRPLHRIDTLTVDTDELPFLYVRVLPFSGDQFLGVSSNQVRLQTGPTQVELDAITALVNEPPEQGDYSMTLGVRGARPPDMRYRHCWNFIGWDDTTRAKHLASQKASYQLYDNLLAKIGTETPICAVCYTGIANPYQGTGMGGFFESAQYVNVGIAGGKCSSGSSCPPIVDIGCQLVGTAIKVWDFAVYVFGELKGWVVDTLATFSGCTTLGGAAIDQDKADALCKLAATIVVDAALIYFGIPPNLPSSKQVIQSAKGDLAATLVELAKSQGVPCDELAEADAVIDTDGLTCQEIAAKIVDKSFDDLYEQFRQAGSSAGFGFPPGMKVMPAPAGQPGGPTIDVTVTPNPGAPLSLKTCDATFLTLSSWKPKPAPGTFLQGLLDVNLAGSPYMPYPYTIPWKTYAGVPFLPVTKPLPQPTSAGGIITPGVASFPIAQPTDQPEVTATHVSEPMGSIGVKTTHSLQVPYHALMMHQGGEFMVIATSPCAGTAHATVLTGIDFTDDVQLKGVGG